MAPILIGVIPFGVIAGVAAVESGVGAAGGVGLSLLVFAGASQLAVMDLIGQDAAIPVIVLTAWVINSRMMMYSASLSPWWASVGRLRKVPYAYLLTDQAYAVSISRYERLDEPVDARLSYYFGAAIALWSTWQISTVVGLVLGEGVPASWSLDFAVPLVFLALLVPAVTNRPRFVAALVGGVVAVIAAPMPYNLGLLVASATGIGAGTLASQLGGES